MSKASRRTSIATPESSARWPRLGEQAVGDVDHRRGAGLRGDASRVVRRLGAAVGLDQHPGRAEAASEYGEPGRPPSPGVRTARGRRRARRPTAAPATACTSRARSPRSPGRPREVRSPPTTEAPTSPHSSAKPWAKSSAHWAGRSRGRGEADGQRVRAAPHRVDVGEVRGRGPVPDVGRRGPVAAEVPALDEQVGGDHARGRRGCAARRRRRPGPTSTCSPCANTSRRRSISGELAGLRDGRVSGERHAPIPPDRGAVASRTRRATCRARRTAR